MSPLLTVGTTEEKKKESEWGRYVSGEGVEK